MDQTVLDPPEKDPPKKKSTSKKKVSKIAFTPKEVETKLDIIFKFVARISGREYNYQPKDYDQEAAGLVRLADKYEIVNTLLVIFDPLVVITGLITKFMTLKKNPGTMKDDKKATEKENSNNLQIVGG